MLQLLVKINNFNSFVELTFNIEVKGLQKELSITFTLHKKNPSTFHKIIHNYK